MHTSNIEHVAVAHIPPPPHAPPTSPKADSKTEYTWAQTWRICTTAVHTLSHSTRPASSCDDPKDPTKGTTHDEMATLLGWTPSGDRVLYVEQNGTSVGIYAMDVANDVHSRVTILGLPQDASSSPGVVGGGFRSTSRATINANGWLGFTWEAPTTPQQAFIGRLSTTTAPLSTTVDHVQQVSQVSKAAVAHGWANRFTWTLHHWKSDDGMPVEGILLTPTPTTLAKQTARGGTALTGQQGQDEQEEQKGEVAPPPLIVFTHCGPAMASLATFIGAGSVCARFPLATWAERGLTVLMPNYRGSTGYGKAFRTADYGGWGGGDYNDVMTGFTSLAAAGKASLSNCAHVGWSYGGYVVSTLTAPHLEKRGGERERGERRVRGNESYRAGSWTPSLIVCIS